MSLTAQGIARLDWSWKDAQDLTTVNEQSYLLFTGQLASGTGYGQADTEWNDSRSLETTVSESLDLTALTRTVFGETVTTSFASVKKIVIFNTATTAGEDLVLDATVANGFITPFNAGTKVAINAGSPFFAFDPTGWTVTAGTGDLMKITNAGSGTITYSIFLAGVST